MYTQSLNTTCIVECTGFNTLFCKDEVFSHEDLLHDVAS